MLAIRQQEEVLLKKLDNTPIEIAIRDSKTLRETPDDVVKRILLATTIKAYMKCGYKNYTDDEVIFLVNETFNYLKQYHLNLRAYELPICIHKGCVGEYGEFAGLSFRLFANWFNKYKVEHDKALQKLLNQKPIEEYKKDNAITFEELKKHNPEIYNNFKKILNED
jgi:hypothetical protein